MIEKHQLSKSTFIRSVQCLKSLYLYKNRYFLRDKLSEEQRAKFKRGTKVGIYAQDLFPGGINLQPKSPSQYRKAVENTRKAIEEETSDIIYEATFQANRVLVILDILVKRDGKFYAYEVKSSKSISDTYVLDAALQYNVIINAGIELEDISIIHMDENYVREGDIEIDKLFKTVTVKEKVIELQNFIETHIPKAKESIYLKKSPAIDIGPHCNIPYPCEFQGHCWKHLPEQSIFDLSAFSLDEKFEVYKSGTTDLHLIDIKDNSNSNRKNQLKAHKENKVYFDIDKIQSLLKTSNEVGGFIEFSLFHPAIPIWNNTKPYESIVFEASIANQNLSKNSHFLVKDEKNPNEALIDFLRNELDLHKTYYYFSSRNIIEIDRNQKLKNYSLINLFTVFNEFMFYSPFIKDNFSLQNIYSKLLTENKESESLSDIKLIWLFEDYLSELSIEVKKELEGQFRKEGQIRVSLIKQLFDYFKSL